MAPTVSADEQYESGLDLMRRLPPQETDIHLECLIDLCPHLTDSLLSSIDQPLRSSTDKHNGKEFLLCDYNRDGDSYRSPWSNKYHPPLKDGALPSEKIRKLEIDANKAFDEYRALYYEGGMSSVYLWDTGKSGFAGCVLIKKVGDSTKRMKGCWDAIHVLEVNESPNGKKASYYLCSTVMLWLQTDNNVSGQMNLGGNISRDCRADHDVSEANSHLVNIGRMVEDMEIKIRSSLSEIYFSKTKDILNGVRSSMPLLDKKQQDALKNDLHQALKKRQMEKTAGKF